MPLFVSVIEMDETITSIVNAAYINKNTVPRVYSIFRNSAQSLQSGIDPFFRKGFRFQREAFAILRDRIVTAV
jgi:hypothetical protein